MIKKGKYITFVFRGRWDKSDPISNHLDKNHYKLGIWLRTYRAVGSVIKTSNRKETVERTFSSDNLVRGYIIGFDLIVCKFWFDIKMGRLFDL